MRVVRLSPQREESERACHRALSWRAAGCSPEAEQVWNCAVAGGAAGAPALLPPQDGGWAPDFAGLLIGTWLTRRKLAGQCSELHRLLDLLPLLQFVCCGTASLLPYLSLFQRWISSLSAASLPGMVAPDRS